MLDFDTGMERVSKRQRTANYPHKNDGYNDLTGIQDAQIEGDSLASPVVRTALDNLISSRKMSATSRNLAKQSLREVKSSLDRMSVIPFPLCPHSTAARDVVRKVATSASLNDLFLSPNFMDLKVECGPPSKVNVVGSFLLGLSSTPVVDIAVEVPPQVFHPKDYLNYRYHDKRLLYLLYLARHFIESDEIGWLNISITTHFFANDTRKPTLSLRHPRFDQITIRIIPTYAVDLFDVSRLTETRRNIRPRGSSSVVEHPMEATIAYNHSILADAKPLQNLQTLHAISSTSPSFVPSVLLLECWSIRHSLKLGKFVFAALVSDLISRSVLPRRASREHFLRSAFSAIHSHALDGLQINGLKICSSVNTARLHRISQCAATALRVIECRSAVDDPWYGAVPFLFVKARGNTVSPLPLCTLFDGFISIQHNTNVPSENTADELVLLTLQRALIETKRVSQIEPLGKGVFGLTFSSFEDVVRKVDIRPENINADSFKDFWGDKTSLRRFKNGKIIESLIWCGGMQTLREIVTYALDMHFGDILNVQVHVGDVEQIAKLSDSNLSTNRAIASFNQLASLLRSVQGLPLRVRDVHATSPYLRRCGLFSIRPNPGSAFIEPLDVVLSFETSHAWPNSPIAIAASKAAFYVALKGKLGESGVSSRATISFLDVVLGGFVFRLRLRVDKEGSMLEGTKEGEKLKLETETAIRHHDDIRIVDSSIMGIVCQLAKRWLNAHMLFASLGDRRDVLVEMLVASTMCSRSVAKPSSVRMAFCRFLHLLSEFPWEVCPLLVSFVSEDDERINVDSNYELDRLEALSKALRDHNEKKAAFGVYAAHGEEVEAICGGSDNGVERAIVARIQATASAALQHMDRHVMSTSNDVTLATLFKMDTEGYDLVVKLDEAACIMTCPMSNGLGSRNSSGKPKFHRDVDQFAAGLDPVERIWQLLVQRLGRWALFLRRVRNGSEVYVVWRPVARKQDKFSLRAAPFCEPYGNQLIIPSTAELIEEIRLLGQSLVTDVRKL